MIRSVERRRYRIAGVVQGYEPVAAAVATSVVMTPAVAFP